MELRDLEKKYNIIYINGLRFYLQDLNIREYLYENTLPLYFEFEDIEIFCNSWKNMIFEIVKAIDKKFPKTTSDLLSIKCDWGKQSVFSMEKKTNFIPYNGLYINCNHNSVHAMWTIQLILKEYNIPLDKCIFIIKRQPIAEPKEVKDYIRPYNIDKFNDYLIVKKGFDKPKADSVIKCLEYVNKIILPKITKGYSDFFLIEDQYYLSNYKSKVCDYIKSIKTLNDSKKRTIEYCLKLFLNFNKEESINRKNNHTSFFKKRSVNFEDELMKLIALDYLSN